MRLLSSAVYTGSLGVFDGQIVVGDGTGNATCRVSIVGATTLHVVSTRDASCTDPSIFGRDVAPVEQVPSPKSKVGYLRIASKTMGDVHLGPVLMRYTNASVSTPQWTYGDGFLWIVGTKTGTSSQSEALRISATTGQLTATIPLPALNRVELAANDDGLWIARSQETTTARSAVVYFVGDQAHRARAVVEKGDYATWLAATRHSAWASLIGYDQSGYVVAATFSNANSKPRTVSLPTNTIGPIETGQELFDAQPVVADPLASRLFFVTTASKGTPSVTYQRVYTFDPQSGLENEIATVRTLRGTFQSAVVYNGALYLLTGGGSLYATLYRIRP